MKTLMKPVFLGLAMVASATASAKTFEWRITSPQAHAETFTAYHGETVRFNPVWSGALSNVTSSVLYYQTNGMDRTWWQADGLMFAPSNDVGAASYRFFVRATDPEGVNYTANGLLRLMESPGFVPNTITPPVAALDFDNIDVSNAPYYTKDETDAKIVELSPPADLSGYATTQSLMAEVSSASQSATNYTDGVATALRGEIAAATPEDYDTVKSNATVAAEAVAGLGDLAWIDGLEWSAIIDRPTTWAWSAITGKPTTWAWSNISDKPSWIGSSKPSYSLNEICPDSENWLGVQGNAGRTIKILAQGSGSSPAGGVQVTASTLNNNNTTTYAYSGVAVKRNGVNTDYLWDSTSSSGIVRRSELASLAPATNIARSALAQDVQASLDKADSALQTAPVSSVNNKTGAVTLTASDVGAIGNSGNQDLYGNLSFWSGQLVFEFWDAMLTPVMSVMNNTIYFPSQSGVLALTAGHGYAGNLAALDVNGNPVDSGIAKTAVAPLASPAFTGTPTAPTPTAGDDSTKVATTAFVQEAISGFSWSATNTVAVIARHTGKETVSIPSGGNLVADLSGWNDGVQTFVVLQPSGAYTVASNVEYCGYGTWPTNTALCVAWPYAGTLYVNPIAIIRE